MLLDEWGGVEVVVLGVSTEEVDGVHIHSCDESVSILFYIEEH